MNAVIPRLVQVQDRLTLGSESAVWRINPRTGFLEARAGLSWTGVREYRTPQGLLRVLRRPEQVNSPGHLKTLRRLPCADGHPEGGADVYATNVERFGVGMTGDAITIEELGGYPRPVGDVSVTRPSVIAKMLPRDAWAKYCEDFPDAAKLGIVHDGGPARTGTSLGYNALWYGPYVDSEIVSERDDGSLVGEWQGPRGPEQYDIEHVVDPECDIVKQLARNTGFNPEVLGGNHFAVALQALGGRGAEQSELMRIVDSADLPITGELSRRMTRLALQVPRMPAPARDEKWTVGASRDLPIVPGDWDGDAAAASVFAWAGFDADKPDPAKARQAFLIYDADAPEIRASYKLPIAEHRDGGLRVVKGGLDAAASYLPQTDAPQDVLDRARDVLDHYYARWEEKQPEAARDALPHREHHTMNKKVIEITLGRDAAKALAKLDPTRKVPAPLTLTLDEIDADKLMGKLSEMSELFGDLMEMVGTAKGEAKEMEDKYDGAMKEMSDMMSVAEASKKVDEVKAMLADAEKALGEAKAAEESATKTADSLRATIDALEAELAPHREAQVQAFRDSIVAAGFDKAQIDACKSVAEIKRHVVAARVGERFLKSRDVADGAKEYVLGDEIVDAAFEGWHTGMQAAKPAAQSSAKPEPSRTFDSFPKLTLAPQRDAANPNENKDPVPASTAAETHAGMACL